MPQINSIPDSAGRRLLPQADLQIGGASPEAFGAGVGSAVKELGGAGADAASALQGFQLAKEREQDQAAEFDRQAQFVKFGSGESERLDQASRDIEGPALDFTKTFMGAFDQNREEFLAKVPARHRAQWDAKFAALRGTVAGAALKTEFGQRDAWSKGTLETSLSALQNGVAQSPGRSDDYRRQGEELINASLLGRQDKADAINKWHSTVSIAAAMGDVELDPYGAVARLGGTNPVTIYDAKGGPPPTQPVTPSGALADNIVGGLKNRGLTDAQARGVAAGIAAESSNTVNAFNKDGGGEGAFGLGQWRGARLKALRARYGPNPTGSQQLDFLVAELRGGDAGGKAVISQDNEVAVLHHYIHDFMRPSAEGGRGDMKRGLAALGQKVDVAALPVAALPVAADAAPGPKPIPAGWKGNTEDAIQELGMTAPQAEEFIKTGTDPRLPEKATALAGTSAPAEPPPIDPRYANLPLSVRMQLIEGAQREIERRDNMQHVTEQKTHNDQLNTLLNDLNDGKAGTADIDAARKAGWLTDYDEINRAQGVFDAKNKANEDLDRFNLMMNTPNFGYNHFDGDQKKAVDAGVEALGNTPMAAFQVWQKTHILATKGAQALRGSILSTDPTQVQQAASIASNMIEHDPNAFTGVEGGEDIEKNAMTYRHEIDGLGRSPEEAVRIIAAGNAPEAKRQLAANVDAEKSFRGKVQKTDVANVLSNALGGWFVRDPDFTSPEQKAAVQQDFADLAWDHYQQYHDEGAANSYATQQIRKLYGTVDGRLMKYPPTRAYPPVNGSWNYLFEQAAKDVKSATGKTVKPSDVYLMPLPTATAEAFRARRPVPYEVHYVEHVDGQAVYQVLHGKAFVGDVAAQHQTSNEALFHGGQSDRAALAKALGSARIQPGMHGRDY